MSVIASFRPFPPWIDLFIFEARSTNIVTESTPQESAIQTEIEQLLISKDVITASEDRSARLLLRYVVDRCNN